MMNKPEIITQVVMSMFTIRDAIHMLHLMSDDYNEHEILDAFYKNIIDKADRVFESSKGMNISISLTKLPALDVGGKEAKGVLIFFKEFISNTRKENEFSNDISSILDEVEELTSSTVYKLDMVE